MLKTKQWNRDPISFGYISNCKSNPWSEKCKTSTEIFINFWGPQWKQNSDDFFCKESQLISLEITHSVKFLELIFSSYVAMTLILFNVFSFASFTKKFNVKESEVFENMYILRAPLNWLHQFITHLSLHTKLSLSPLKICPILPEKIFFPTF